MMIGILALEQDVVARDVADDLGPRAKKSGVLRR